MIKKLLAGVISGLFLCSMVGTAHASLTTIGSATYGGDDYNLIYDDVNLITWLDYTNDPGAWANQISWADDLNGAGILNYNLNANIVTSSWDDNDPWRLPYLGEMQGLSSTGSFSNIETGLYWSYSSPYSGWAFHYDFSTGSTNLQLDWYSNKGIAIRTGMVEIDAVPIPGTAWLLGASITALVGIRRRRKKK